MAKPAWRPPDVASGIDRGYADRAFLAQHLERHIPVIPAQHQIDARLPEPEVAQEYRVQECRQARIAQPDLVGIRIEFEAERGLDERERRPAGPSLGRTSHRIERRAPALPALEPAEQLRQAAQVHIGGGVEQTAKQALELVLS